MLAVLFVIAAALVIGDRVYRYLQDTQIAKRGKLQNAQNAKPDAVIAKAEPAVAGTKRNRHYIYVVTFSDGTVYQDTCGVRDPSLGRHGMRFDNERAAEIEKAAIAAHQKATGM